MDIQYDQDLMPRERDLEILYADGSETGLRLKIRPETDKKYQQTFRWAKDQYSDPKTSKNKQKKREIGEKLLVARLAGWECHGKFKELNGEIDFNRINAHEILFKCGEFSAMVEKQLNEAIQDDNDFLPEE